MQRHYSFIRELGLVPWRPLPDLYWRVRVRLRRGPDALTGLGYSGRFEARARRMLRRGDLGLVLVNVDYMKRFNACSGHSAGDRVIVRIAGAVGEVSADAGGEAFRTGGDEFTVLCPGSSAEETAEIAARIERHVSSLGIVHPASPTGVSVTAGVAHASKQRPGTPTPLELHSYAERDLLEKQFRSC